MLFELTPFTYFALHASYDIEITREVLGRAPIPELMMGVKQDGEMKLYGTKYNHTKYVKNICRHSD